MSRHLVAFLMGILGCFAHQAPASDVGVARIDITPSQPILLHGFAARSGESTGVDHKIEAQALALGTDLQKPLVLITVDSLGIPSAVVEEVAARLKTRANVDRERFAVAASHTHYAPILRGIAPNIFGKPIAAAEQAKIDAYTKDLTDKLESVALAALKNREPSFVRVGRGSTGFAANRRRAGGPVDHDVPVLWVTDAQGKPRAVLTAYACHCTTIDPSVNHIDADWAGYARDGIEAAHPGAIAMIAIGCGADSNPSPRGRLEDSRNYGKQLADEVLRVIAAGADPLDTTVLKAAMERIQVPLDTPPSRDALLALIKGGGAPGANAKVHLDRLDRGEPLQTEVDYPIVSWSIGDAQEFVFLAGEVVVDYAVRLKREFDRPRLWVIAYANDVPGYIPSERILREGGYEGGGAMVYYAFPAPYKTGVEALIVDAVKRLVPASFLAPKDANAPQPKEPDEALRTIQVGNNWKVELVAAEPLVVDPVAIDWGTDGSLWVCEMRDYPTGMDGHFKPGGQIKRLRDTDGDGRYDTSTVFLDGLPFPTGVMAWKSGVLVCAAPELLYAEDTDGDGRADVRRVLFRGFATENYQARVNGLSYGLDNWVYGANGLIGGVIRGEASGQTVDIGGRDFRIRPDTGAMEPAAGLSQQGRIHDDWGHQFGNSNSVLLQQYPMADSYARRNPSVASPPPGVYVPRDADSARLHPSSITRDRYNEPQSANRVTSACGPGIYRDRLLGQEFAGNAFICEPVHNLVHREVLSDDGVLYAGHRAADEADREFLSSTDPMFRPVQVRTGPDGALYVVDMYRFVIEHPRWIEPEMLRSLDVRAGDAQGRIYRVVPRDRPLRAVPNLDAMDTLRLARALESSNGTLRDNVQRLLVHRADPAAIPVLEELARGSQVPECRVQAMASLDGLNALTPSLIQNALGDRHPGVRAEAARLAESRLGEGSALGTALATLADDRSPRVRFQAALSLGAWDDPLAGEALGRILSRDAGDPWIVAAVMSAAARDPVAILRAVLSADLPEKRVEAVVSPLIATAAASGRANDVLHLLANEPAKPSAWRFLAISEILDAVPEAAKTLPEGLRADLAAAGATARDAAIADATRIAAVKLLGRDRDRLADDLETLGGLLDVQSSMDLQRASLASLSRIDDPRASDAMIRAWNEVGPDLRRTMLDLLLGRARGTLAVLSACETGSIRPGELDAVARQRLIRHDDPTIRDRAAKLWSQGAREGVVERYRKTSGQTADPSRGSAVFARVCGACHRLAGQGVEVGPDLEALTDRSAAAMARAVFDPNHEVDARYTVYAASLKDGRVVSGVMAAETGNSVTLKRQGGELDVILRKDLEELKATGQSLMPEGLETDLSPEDFPHLVAYLGKTGPRPKAIAGNQPAVVAPEPSGAIRLQATKAEIYGDSLIFEPEHENLGYWQSPSDRAAWSFHVDRPGRYRVRLLGACDKASAGNRLGIRQGDQALEITVPATGPDWSNYETIEAGEIDLKAGDHRLEARALGDLSNALIDLKTIVIEPISPKP